MALASWFLLFIMGPMLGHRWSGDPLQGRCNFQTNRRGRKSLKIWKLHQFVVSIRLHRRSTVVYTS
jgi:hypothetical protein